MGTFKIKFWIADLAGKNQIEVEGYVDTGATYSIVPREILEKLGIKKIKKNHY